MAKGSTRSKTKKEVPATPPRETDTPFPIVGLGASAGGLEALEQFLRGVPEGSGIAFVVVQHLDPDHQGVLAEMLQRATPMPVSQVKDRVRVAPNRVYVIPPNRDLELLQGRLHLSEPAAPRGLRLSIDNFFQSLADDRREQAIGVVLSGMGSDGTLGLRAIKERAGLALAQEPTTAKFDAMPRSAIEAGLADLVAPAGELATKMIAYLRHASLWQQPVPILDKKAKTGLEKVVLQLRRRTGHDFSLYKKSTLYRRIERRMSIHQIDRIAQYARYLQENPAEVDLLFKELLIGVTRFFREPEAWEFLKTKALADLLASRPAGATLRAWVVGCSTGEEAYSLAILFREALQTLRPKNPCSLQIFATDLDREAVEQARQGLFPANVAADVSAERLAQWFTLDGGGYRVVTSIREMVIFAPHNVIADPPFTKLDLLVCRNLLIYFDPQLQKKLLPLFHYTLNPGGVLFLGSAESVGECTDQFETLANKARVFRRRETPQRLGEMAFPPGRHTATEAPQEAAKPLANLEVLIDKLVLQSYAPAAVLVSAEGDLLYATSRTGKYLEPSVGKANLNVFAMAREGLQAELAGALHQAHREGSTVTRRGLTVGGGGEQSVDLTVEALQQPAALRGKFLLVFTAPAAASEPAAAGKRGARRRTQESARNQTLQQELQRTREELQSTHEEMQSSQEELKSANEELQSTNEELQSTNEELTTSREEMQSMNEELQTLNSELSANVEELSQQSNDLRNLLNSTEIATLFLDNALHVRRFTEQATEIIKLISSDVGRPFTDLSSSLDYPELAEDASEVLRTLVPREKEATTRDGRCYRVRIMPYRTTEDRIDGVVITFTDISSYKILEAELRRARNLEGESP